MAAATTNPQPYSSIEESSRILKWLLQQLDSVSLPSEVEGLASQVKFTATRDAPYFPIPFKETETGAALKAVEGIVACLLADLKNGAGKERRITVNLEKTTAFLCQAYMAKVGGLGKLDAGVKKLLKGEMTFSKKFFFIFFTTVD